MATLVWLPFLFINNSSTTQYIQLQDYIRL